MRNTNEQIYVIGIAGPSCSGKSTISNLLCDEYDLACVHADNFYFDDTQIPRYGGFTNWEDPHSIDVELLYGCINNLKNYQTAYIPIRKAGKRIGYKPIDPKPIILVEGFLIYHFARIRSLIDRRFYLHIDEETLMRRRIARQANLDPLYLQKVLIPYNRNFVIRSGEYSDHIIDGRQSVGTIKEQLINLTVSELQAVEHVPSFREHLHEIG